MSRLSVGLTASTALMLFAAPAAAQQAGTEEDLVERARRIHQSVITIDTHDDIPFNFAAEVDPCTGSRMQVDLPKMREGGLDVAFFVVYVGQSPRTPENYVRAQEQAMVKFNAIHRMAKELCPEQIEIAFTADDVERIHRSGRLVAAIGIENGFVIGRDISLLARYHELGARYMTLAHNGHNDIADSWQPSARSGAALPTKRTRDKTADMGLLSGVLQEWQVQTTDENGASKRMRPDRVPAPRAESRRGERVRHAAPATARTERP